MASIRLLKRAMDDLARFASHMKEYGAEEVTSRIHDVVDAIDVLKHTPEMGRPVGGGRRELLIGHGVRGYVAQYRYVARNDTVHVLAVRAQRESGYKHKRR